MISDTARIDRAEALARLRDAARSMREAERVVDTAKYNTDRALQAVQKAELAVAAFGDLDRRLKSYKVEAIKAGGLEALLPPALKQQQLERIAANENLKLSREAQAELLAELESAQEVLEENRASLAMCADDLVFHEALALTEEFEALNSRRRKLRLVFEALSDTSRHNLKLIAVAREALSFDVLPDYPMNGELQRLACEAWRDYRNALTSNPDSEPPKLRV